MIRGAAIDRRINGVLQRRYASEILEGTERLDRQVPGAGNRLRPDVFFPNLDGKSVIFDFGGPSKLSGISKYRGMADYLIPLLHSF